MSTEVGCGPPTGCALGVVADGVDVVVEPEAPEPEVVLEVLVEELELVVEVPEKGLAEPEPQPTIEASATAAAPNFTKTLASNCTLNLATGESQLTESTVGKHQLCLYRGRGLGVLGKSLRSFSMILLAAPK